MLALAMLRPFRGRRVLMVLFVIPLFMSPVIVGVFFDLFLRRPSGPANQIARLARPGPDRRSTSPTTRRGPTSRILVADAWQWTPFMFVILLAGLASIPDEMYEAADLDGAKPRQVVLLRHAAAARADHPGGGHVPVHRRRQAVRHHLHADARAGRGRIPTRPRTTCTNRGSSCSTSARARPARGCSC